MKIERNEILSKYTTVKIGGVAEVMYIPENIDELIDLINTKKPQYFIGGGSNLLISDLHSFDNVVNLREFDKSIIELKEGQFKIGASVRLQSLINYINEKGYGGIEYLFSVPGLVGGAIFMNAGGDKTQGNSISDFIISVDAIVDGHTVTFEKEKCNFTHRNSIFKENNYIVVSAVLKFPKQDAEVSDEKKRDRISFCKEKHDYSGNNFGSVFSVFDPRLMVIIKKLSPEKRTKGIYFSKKTLNWMVNYGNGSYTDAIKRINNVVKFHRLFLKECKTEVIIWK